MSNIDLSKLPQALGQNVERIDPKTGLATQATLDNEFFLATAIKGQLQALDHAVILAQSDADDAQASVLIEAIARSNGDSALSAAVTFEATARANADTSLASAVISSEARSTGGSAATAQMQLVATAGIPGAAAEFSWQLRTSGSNYPVGMTAYASGGVGKIAFTAQQFSLTDPSYLGGAPDNVFSYSAGKWRFGVPVELNTGELAGNSVTSIASNSGIIAGSVLSVSKSFYGGTDAMVIVTLETAGGLSPVPSAAQTVVQRTYTFHVDGTPIDTITAYDSVVGANSATVRDAAGSGTTVVVGALYTGPSNAAKLFFIPGLSAGTHSFEINEVAGLSMQAKIAVVEFKR